MGVHGMPAALSGPASQPNPAHAPPPAALPGTSVHPSPAVPSLQAPTGNEGAPVWLCAVDPILFCSELCSSLSAFRVQAPVPGWPPALIPLSTDRSGSHVAGALPLPSRTHVLAGMRPRGLALLQRSLEAEGRAQAAARRRFDAARERGAAEAAAAGGDEALLAQQQHQHQRGPAFVPATADAADVEVTAACAPATSIAALLLGRLGVPVHELGLEEPLAAAGSSQPAPAAGSEGQELGCIVLSTGGAVHTLRLLEVEQAEPLLQLQQALQQLELREGRGTGALPGVQHQPHWRWSPGEAGGGGRGCGGNCVDSDYVSAGLTRLGGAAAAAEALGLPANVLERAVELLCSQNVP